MEKKSKGIYTLKHLSVLDKVETDITYIIKNEDELELTEIDNFTGQFENPQQLLFYLQKLGFKFYNSKFFIEYQSNHKTKKIDLIFSDQDLVKEFAYNNLGSYKVKRDSLYYYYLNKTIMDYSNNPEMFYYLRKGKYITRWLYENIALYENCKESDSSVAHICLDRIREELSDYQNIRMIEIGKKEYKSLMEFKQKMEERKKTFIKK